MKNLDFTIVGSSIYIYDLPVNDNDKDLEHDGFQNFTNIILGIHRNHHSLE